MPDGEIKLETTLHEVDLLEADVYSFKDAPGDPVGACLRSDQDVMTRGVAFRLLTGSLSTPDRDAEVRYYALLREKSPAELMPVVQLREHQYEGLLRCVRELVGGAPRATRTASEIGILLASNFAAETSVGFVVVDFMTHWCVPCKRMAHDLERLARDYRGKLRVTWLDVDRNMEVMDRFDVKSFPTLVLLKDGSEVARLENSRAYPELETWVQRML